MIFSIYIPNPDEPEPKRINMKERKSLNRMGKKNPTQVGNEISQGLSQTRKRGRHRFHTWQLSLLNIVAQVGIHLFNSPIFGYITPI